jgi:hypothetical protein
MPNRVRVDVKSPNHSSTADWSRKVGSGLPCQRQLTILPHLRARQSFSILHSVGACGCPAFSERDVDHLPNRICESATEPSLRNFHLTFK